MAGPVVQDRSAGSRVERRRAGPGARRLTPGVLAGPLVFGLALIPFLHLVWDGFADRLGANPIEEITLRTGWWTLTLLMVTLAITPARRLTGLNQLVKHRRALGLFTFFYACLHVLTYWVLDQGLAFDYIAEDVLERPYITVGFTAWLLLIPLAVTSTRGWIRRLGKRWQRLHRLAYLVAVLGVVHFLWLVKADEREPLYFAAALVVLLALRLRWPRQPARRSPGLKTRPPETVGEH